MCTMGIGMISRGHPGAFREGEVLQQFQDFREKLLSKFWISLDIFYTFSFLPQLKIGRSQPA